jgi:hypothetical protein
VTEQLFIPKAQTYPGTILVTGSQVKLYVLVGVISVSSWLTADHGMCRLMSHDAAHPMGMMGMRGLLL